MKRHLLTLDQGTTSSRAIVFDRHGRAAGSAQQEHRQIYPRAGWVEHDPEEIWRRQLAVATEALEASGLEASDMAAIGITNQRETVVVWDRRTGEPVGNAIVWQDRRTAEACAALEQSGLGAKIHRRTGLRLDPYFSGTKLRWILDHAPDARARAESGDLCFGTIDCWLVWKLTGGRTHATDASNASRTLLCDLERGEWSEALLDVFGVPAPMLPAIVDSSGALAEATVEPLAGIPITGIAGDQQAALFGQACFTPGSAKNTYGTGCFLLLHTGAEPKFAEGLLSTVAWRIGGALEYALEGSVFIGGAVIQWLRDELRLIDSAEQVNERAAECDDSHGVYLVPAFTGLGAPHWDPYARGAIVGLTRGANRAHLCRAALESIALQTTDLIAAMATGAGLELAELRVDGGASRSDLLLQIQADLLQTDVVRPRVVETTALGAGYLAGLAAGVWASREEIAADWAVASRFTPRRSAADAAAMLHGWRRAVERARGWIEPA